MPLWMQKSIWGAPPYCINEEEQNFFGPGIILFFFYTKRMLLLILSVTLLYGLFALLSNMLSDKENQNCKDHPGAFDFMCEFKI